MSVLLEKLRFDLPQVVLAHQVAPRRRQIAGRFDFSGVGAVFGFGLGLEDRAAGFFGDPVAGGCGGVEEGVTGADGEGVFDCAGFGVGETEGEAAGAGEGAAAVPFLGGVIFFVLTFDLARTRELHRLVRLRLIRRRR